MIILRIGGYKPSWSKNENDVLMTMWNSQPQEAFWFATTVATYDAVSIDTVLVADFTDNDLFEC